MDQVYWGGVVAVVTMYAAFLVVGWLASRKVKEATAADLIVAGRCMPLWIATLTMTATWVDGGYLLGTTEGVFRENGGLLLGVQGGLCFGISLMLGGLFFAKRMRRYEFTTLVDPFEARFGKKWAAVLCVPAMLGEVIWSWSSRLGPIPLPTGEPGSSIVQEGRLRWLTCTSLFFPVYYMVVSWFLTVRLWLRSRKNGEHAGSRSTGVATDRAM